MIGTLAYRANAFSIGSVRSRSQSFNSANVRTPIARNVSLKNTDKFLEVLGFVRVHHDAFAMFERPARAARLEYHRIAAKLVNANLHRCACAKRWG